MPHTKGSPTVLAEIVTSERDALLERWARRAQRFTLGDLAPALLLELGRTLKAGRSRPELLALAEQAALRPDALRELTLLREAALELVAEAGLEIASKEAALLHRTIDDMLLICAGRASEQQTRELELRERFVRVLGHDLRNPISAIKLGSTMLARDVQSAEVRKRTAQRIVSSANRMLRMLEDLLAFLRLRPGAPPLLELGRVSLRELCHAVVQESQNDNPQREITFSADKDVVGRFDRRRLAHALDNVIASALEHSPAESPVSVTLVADDDLRIDVRHRGPVISSRELEGIFDLQKSSDRPARGLGLGLFLADQIVRAHGGRIVAESSAEAGTTFSLILPSPAKD